MALYLVQNILKLKGTYNIIGDQTPDISAPSAAFTSWKTVKTDWEESPRFDGTVPFCKGAAKR